MSDGMRSAASILGTWLTPASEHWAPENDFVCDFAGICGH